MRSKTKLATAVATEKRNGVCWGKICEPFPEMLRSLQISLCVYLFRVPTSIVRQAFVEHTLTPAGNYMDPKFIARRMPEQPVIIEPFVVHWWSGLPPDRRPLNLARAYPRIANNIARLWHDFEKCNKYLSDLLIEPERAQRQGFTLEIAQEISELRDLLSKSKSGDSNDEQGFSF